MAISTSIWYVPSRGHESSMPPFHGSQHTVKGAIHGDIVIPVLIHAIFATTVVYFDQYRDTALRLPSSIIPSLSIVVGLILVFRNQTSYDRFWQGQNQLTTICTSIRNLTRSFLVCSYTGSRENAASPAASSPAEEADIENAIRVLLAYVYAAKAHLRAEWGTALTTLTRNGNEVPSIKLPDRERDGMVDLLQPGMTSYEDRGLGLPVQLTVEIEAFIKRGHDRGWFHAPQASQLTVQLNTAVAAFGSMETIRLTPIPVAYLIHIRQVLALFGGVLPFALVGDMGWWTVLIVTIVTFTLYGVEGIGQQLEDPFGHDKNDIKMDAVIEDLRVEVMVLLDQWKVKSEMFASG